MNNQTALTTLPDMTAQFTRAMQEAKYASDLVRTMRAEKILKAGVDYGEIPGTNKDKKKEKPTLLKPGAEKLTRAFHLCPKFVTLDAVTRFLESDPLFYFRYECQLYDIDTGKMIASANGSCNSMESKYSQRWVSAGEVPSNLDKATLQTRDGRISEPDFAIKKGETTGKYGKPAEYWQAFRDAIANGTAVKGSRDTKAGEKMTTWEIGGLLYAIPNADIFSQVNTLDKMAQKRALIAAVLIGTNASEQFTQDIEDMPGFGFSEYIEAEIVPPDTDVPASTAPKAEAAAPTPQGRATEPTPAANGHSEPAKTIDTAKHNAGVFLKHWENEGMIAGEVLNRLGVQRLSDFGDWSNPQTAIDADWKMSEYHPPVNDANMADDPSLAEIDKAIAKLPKSEATPPAESDDKKIKRWSKKWTNSTEYAPMLTEDDLLSALYVMALTEYPWHWNEKDTDPAADELVVLYVKESAAPKSETAKA